MGDEMLWDPRFCLRQEGGTHPKRATNKRVASGNFSTQLYGIKFCHLFFEYGKDYAHSEVIRLEMLASHSDYGVCSLTFRSYTSYNKDTIGALPDSMYVLYLPTNYHSPRILCTVDSSSRGGGHQAAGTAPGPEGC